MTYDKLNFYREGYRALIDATSHGSMPIATLLIFEAKRYFKSETTPVTEETLYDYIQSRSEFYNVGSVFNSSKDAFRVYNMMQGIEEIDWEEVLGALDYQVRGLMHIPATVLSLYKERISGDVKSMLICEGEKFTPYLHSIVNEHPDCNFTITTSNQAYQAILNYAFEGCINVKVIMADIYEYGFTDMRFDYILSVPDFGRRLVVDLKQTFMCREYELVATENLLLHLTTGGRLLIVLPARMTFTSGNIKQLRDFIQDMYKLEEISELPDGIFLGTGIKTFLFSISTGASDDVTIRKYGVASTVVGSAGRIPREIKLDDETFVFVSELADQGDWNIDKVFASQDEDWQKFLDVKKIALCEVAQVFRGKSITEKSPTGKFGVVNISDLKEYSIDYKNLDHYDGEERRLASYILQDGDIVIPARGTVLKAALFKEQSYPCIASSNLVVIRPKKDLLNSTYLKMFFDSSLGKKLLSSAQQGTTVINISYKDLQYIEIPLPPKEKQDRLASEYNDELKLYLDSIREAENRWTSVVERLQKEL